MTPRSRLFFPTVTLLPLFSLSSADAVVLCAKKSGEVVVRESCKKRETAVLPGAIAVVGPTGPQGPTGAVGPPGMLPYEVVDATGRQFGTLIYRDGLRAQVTTAVSGVDVPLQFIIVEGQFYNEGQQNAVFYDAAGCTGAPSIPDAGGIVPHAHVLGTRAYFSRAQTTLRSIQSQEFVPSTPGSCGASTDTGRQTCCFDTTGMVNASPAETFDPSVLGVTPPFSVVAR